MKRFALLTMSGLAAVMLFGGCASKGLGDSSSSSGGSVPGERKDGSSVEAGPGMGPSAKVGF